LVSKRSSGARLHAPQSKRKDIYWQSAEGALSTTSGGGTRVGWKDESLRYSEASRLELCAVTPRLRRQHTSAIAIDDEFASGAYRM
jgi:hypothetical protein